MELKENSKLDLIEQVHIKELYWVIELTVNNSSKWETIKCSVPQGLILGPLFFLLYINDLPKIIIIWYYLQMTPVL